MKKIILFLIISIGSTLANATELLDKLRSISGVVSVEELPNGVFTERYVVILEQPLDHKNAAAGKFTQRVVVAHSGFDRPTLLITEGYGGDRAISPKYRDEISTQLNTNQIFVEHRFFGPSTPNPRNWDYMTGENAAADLHKVRVSLKDIYPAKWVASGISKGGQNTMIYAAYYPNDVDVYVPYVGPVCFGVEDGRHEPFLEKVGTEQERQTIYNYQVEVLKRRDEMMPMFKKYCDDKQYTFRIPMEEIFDYCVLEFPFALWQMGVYVNSTPGTTESTEKLFDHLMKSASPSYFAINDEPSFFAQAARELGYYGYDIKPFEGLLAVTNSEGYLAKIFLPEDAQGIKFDNSLSIKITEYLKNNDPKMIFIYGELDPWSAVMPSPELFNGKKNMKLYIEERGSHRARIGTQSQEAQDEIWTQLNNWLN